MNRPAGAACADVASLNDYELGAFITAAHRSDSEVWVEILASLQCQDLVLNSIGTVGGQVRFVDKKIGYALFRISSERVLDTLDIAGVDYATIPQIFRAQKKTSVANLTAAPAPQYTLPFPEVSMVLSADGPYFPAAEAGLTALWAKYPEADGRGVRIAVVDSGFDLLHPAVLLARDAHGSPVPKVAAIETPTWPEVDDRWVQFGPAIRSHDGVLRAEDREWRVPADSEYRFGVFHRKLTLGIERRPKEHPVAKVEINAGVLWNEKEGEAWFDTDGDGDFTRERRLTDYSVKQDVAWFGNQTGTIDNRIPFGIKIAPNYGAIYVSIGEAHGAMIAGPMAGNRLTGGLFDGAAPSAQLMDFSLAFSLLPSHLRAFARNDADILNRSGGIARAVPNEEFAQHVLDRALAEYRKPFVCFCYLGSAIHVNDYQSAEMLRRNRRVTPHNRDAVNSSAWFDESGLINSVLAPSTALLTESRYMPQYPPLLDGKRNLTRELVMTAPTAPAGYSIGSNASPTISFVSGVLADLISQARKSEVRYDNIRLTNALFTSAKQLPGFSTAQQGHGLVDAAGAWEQLAKMAKADDPKNPTLTSFTVARRFDRNNSGTRLAVHGFYMDVPKAGATIRGQLWLTRVGGYNGSRAYRLALRADDGTFRLAESRIAFPRSQAVEIRFKAKATPGRHVAFMQLIDAHSDAVIQEIPLSLRAPEAPATIAPGTERYVTTLDPLRSEARYVRLEGNVQAAGFVMQIPYSGPEWQAHCWMPGFVCNAVSPPPGESLDARHHVGPVQTFESLVENRVPRTVEIFWSNRGNPEYGTEYDGHGPDVSIRASLTVRKYALAFASARGKLRVKNQLADIEGQVEVHDATRLSSVLHGEGPHGSAALDRALPAHLSQWRVALSTHVPADAFLMNCTDETLGCLVAESKAITQNQHHTSFVVTTPQPGRWRIVIRVRNRTETATDYQVNEALLSRSPVTIESGSVNHPSGEIWTVRVPPKNSALQYVAFRIAGLPTHGDHKDGLLIAMTPLDSDGP